jgi:hypothetical protein
MAHCDKGDTQTAQRLHKSKINKVGWKQMSGRSTNSFF